MNALRSLPDDSDSDTTSSHIGITAEAGLPFRYEAKLYGIAGLNATLEPKLNLTYRPLETKDLALTGRLNGAIGAVFELDLEVKKHRSETQFINATLWGPKELWSRTNPTTPGTTAPTALTLTGSYDAGELLVTARLDPPQVGVSTFRHGTCQQTTRTQASDWGCIVCPGMIRPGPATRTRAAL